MIEILDSTASHARELSKTLKHADKLETIRMGLNPDKALFQTYKRALYRKTALVDGKVSAMWGVVGTPLSMIGIPYLLTGDGIDKTNVFTFVKIYCKEVQNMKKLFPVLENYVDASYTSAVRMLVLAGFKLERGITLNNFEFYKFTLSTV